MNETEAGIQIEVRKEHSSNALSSIRTSLEPDSKVTVRRHRQPEKAFVERTSTDEGIQTDESNTQAPNAHSGMTRILDGCANATFAKDMRFEKH
jgi:hypothetical protein